MIADPGAGDDVSSDRPKTMISNPPKFWLLLTAIVGVIVLMALQRVEPAVGMPFLMLACGIGIGNGIALKRGETVEPILGPKPDPAPAPPTG